jgi:hypothetical protein
MTERQPHPGYTAWGPFVSDDYYIQPLSRRANIISGIIFGVAMLLALLAGYYAVYQTKASRIPAKSPYIWMIWLELVACVALAIECFCYLHMVIRPSFYFFMSVCKYSAWSAQHVLMLVSAGMGYSSPAPATDHHQSNTRDSTRSKER